MRIIDQKLWQDLKWRKDLKNINERYFWLYLLSCPASKTCGIFYLPIEIMVMETKLAEEDVKKYLEHFTKLNMIRYNYETEEILIYNLPRYNIIRLGKPMEDCIKSELSNIKDSSLINSMINFIDNYITNRVNDKKLNILSSILNIYKESINISISISNESCHDSFNDSLEKEWNSLMNELSKAGKHETKDK